MDVWDLIDYSYAEGEGTPEMRTWSWSPDGTHLALEVNDQNWQDEDHDSLVVLDAMTGDVNRVITGFGSPQSIYTWSPDGSALVFSTSSKLSTFDLGTGEVREIAPASAYAAAFSASGADVVFLRDEDGPNLGMEDTELVLAPLNGGDLVELTETAEPESMPITWSPDGGSVLFWRKIREVDWTPSGVFEGSWALFAIDVESRTETRLGGAGLFQTGYPSPEPAWSPDGDWLAMAGWRDGSAGIYMVNVDASDAIQVAVFASGFDYSDIRWSEDGQRLSFTSSAPSAYRGIP